MTEIGFGSTRKPAFRWSEKKSPPETTNVQCDVNDRARPQWLWYLRAEDLWLMIIVWALFDMCFQRGGLIWMESSSFGSERFEFPLENSSLSNFLLVSRWSVETRSLFKNNSTWKLWKKALLVHRLACCSKQSYRHKARCLFSMGEKQNSKEESNFFRWYFFSFFLFGWFSEANEKKASTINVSNWKINKIQYILRCDGMCLCRCVCACGWATVGWLFVLAASDDERFKGLCVSLKLKISAKTINVFNAEIALKRFVLVESFSVPLELRNAKIKLN